MSADAIAARTSVVAALLVEDDYYGHLVLCLITTDKDAFYGFFGRDQDSCLN
jgi:hypothetical protein